MSKIVMLSDVRVVNLAPRQEGVWAGRIAPRTTYRSDWPANCTARRFMPEQAPRCTFMGDGIGPWGGLDPTEGTDCSPSWELSPD